MDYKVQWSGWIVLDFNSLRRTTSVMNRDDQTYLLNSEILVIVGHILDRREKQLMKNGACEETEELTAKSEGKLC